MKKIFYLLLIVIFPINIYSQNVNDLNKKLLNAINAQDTGMVVKLFKEGADLMQLSENVDVVFMQNLSKLQNLFMQNEKYREHILLTEFSVSYLEYIEMQLAEEYKDDIEYLDMIRTHKYFYFQELYNLSYSYRRLYFKLTMTEKGLLTKSEYYLLKCIKVLKDLSVNSMEYLTVLRDLSLNYLDQKKFEEAEKYATELLLIVEQRNIKKENSLFYSSILGIYSDVKSGVGNFDEALTYKLRQLDFIIEEFGKDFSYFMGLNSLSKLYETFGKIDEAEKQYFENLTIIQDIKGVYSFPYAETILNLSFFYRNQGLKDKADLYLDKFSEIMNVINGVQE